MSAAPTEAAVREALRNVIDPEIRRNVVELGMVGPLELAGPEVRVTIVLTVPGCPLKQNIESQVRTHVGAVPGVERVAVAFTHMSDEQRTALRQQLQGAAGGETKGLSVDPRTRVLA